jgi:hypothetical protein
VSQFPYPPPYTPPPIDYRAWGTPQTSSAANTAALWQAIVGGLLFLGSACFLSAVWIVPEKILQQAIEQQHIQLGSVDNMSAAQMLRLGMTVILGLGTILGLSLLILTYFVRRGGKTSAVFSMVLVGLFELFVLLNFLGAFLQFGSPQAILSLLLNGGLLALGATTLIKLAAALKSNPAQMQAMQQAYYWMMQQQQQSGTGAPGYGYGQVPPPSQTGGFIPAPPPPPPPPAQPAPPPENKDHSGQ